MDVDGQPTLSAAPTTPLALNPVPAHTHTSVSLLISGFSPHTTSTASTPALDTQSSSALTPTSSNAPPKTASNRSASSQGKRKYSALGNKEAQTKSTKLHSEASASGPAALLHGFHGSIDSIKDHLQMTNSVSPALSRMLWRSLMVHGAA